MGAIRRANCYIYNWKTVQINIHVWIGTIQVATSVKLIQRVCSEPAKQENKLKRQFSWTVWKTLQINRQMSWKLGLWISHYSPVLTFNHVWIIIMDNKKLCFLISKLAKGPEGQTRGVTWKTTPASAFHPCTGRCLGPSEIPWSPGSHSRQSQISWRTCVKAKRAHCRPINKNYTLVRGECRTIKTFF